LTEVAQLAGDFNSSSNYVASGLPKFNDLAKADFVMNPGRTISITDLPNLSNENIKVEVENCISALSKIDMDVILVNTTHSGLEIPAFYAIIPGAHFRERAAGTSVGMFSAKLVAESGDPEWAFNELTKMEELLPNKYFIKFFLGLSRLSTNEPLEAFRYLEQSLDLEPKKEDIPSIYSYMGVCLRDLEKYTEALKILEKGRQQDNDRTDIHNLMGFCYFKLKEHEKAIECFREVIKLDPTS
ncbi:MAG: tetratricopeptide repeat protein, partial [Desulfobacterales bacterium]|nr:tetratricopeptide repeat protein [Desulfobacterales bacterium]